MPSPRRGIVRILAISGTPGVGKSSISKRLSEVLGVPWIDLSQAVIENKLYVEFDDLRASYIIDEARVREYLERMYREHGPYILASHYAEIVPHELLELIVVIRLHPLHLIERLTRRGWSCRKVAENVEAELLSVCTRNAVDEHGDEMVVEIDATGRSVDDVVSEILSIVFGERSVEHGHRIDWLSQLSSEELTRVLSYIEACR